MTSPITTAIFISRAKEIHGSKYDYSEMEYVNKRTKLKIKCNTCGKYFYQSPLLHLKSKHCPYCFGTYNYSKAEVLEQLRIMFGDKYEYLDIENYKNKHSYLIIRCKKCNRIFKQKLFIHKAGSGCRYCNSSKGECTIDDYLTKNNIVFYREKWFEDCRNKNPLPFDFYLPDYNLCIEFQGQHHYLENRYFKHDTLKYRKYNDKIKREYCNKNGIKLLEIKYDENIIDKLEKGLKHE